MVPEEITTFRFLNYRVQFFFSVKRAQTCHTLHSNQCSHLNTILFSKLSALISSSAPHCWTITLAFIPISHVSVKCIRQPFEHFKEPWHSSCLWVISYWILLPYSRKFNLAFTALTGLFFSMFFQPWLFFLLFLRLGLSPLWYHFQTSSRGYTLFSVFSNTMVIFFNSPYPYRTSLLNTTEIIQGHTSCFASPEYIHKWRPAPTPNGKL